jgi:hypothetical protein
VTTVVAALCIAGSGSQGSGAAAPGRTTDGAWETRHAEGGVAQSAQVTTQSTAAAPERCPHARKALRYYRARYAQWRHKMGAGKESVVAPTSACPRYLARVWRAKARAARKAYQRWWARTPKLAGETWRDVRLDSPVNRNLWRIAVCETGGINGGQPLWTHHNSVYSGALGFAHSTWAHWRHYVRPLPPPIAAHASPAEQLAVGRALVRSFGGYSSWPACHRRLGLGR